MRFLILFAFWVALILHPTSGAWASTTSSSSGSRHPAAGLVRLVPPWKVPALRRSSDPRERDDGSGVASESSPEWQDENDDLDGFGVGLRAPLVSAPADLVTGGEPTLSLRASGPPVRSPQLRC